MLRTIIQRGAVIQPSSLARLGSAATTLTPQLQRRNFSSRDDVIKAIRMIEDSPTQFIEKYVADDVLWTVTEPSGKSTPISGMYKSRKAFLDEAFGPLSEVFEEPIKLNLVDMVVQDRDNTDLTKVCVELEGTSKLKKDSSEWKNYYSWVMHFRKEQAIVVRAYLDSAAVNAAMK